MGQERLTGLAFLHEVDPERVIDRFAKAKNRRREFVL
jgi:hypothetical protein